MKEQIINEIQRKMLPYLNNEQLIQLKDILNKTMYKVVINKSEDTDRHKEYDMIEMFISAKRIEGCSEKTLHYYKKTIESMVLGIKKTPPQITTDDLRRYLTNYQ